MGCSVVERKEKQQCCEKAGGHRPQRQNILQRKYVMSQPDGGKKEEWKGMLSKEKDGKEMDAEMGEMKQDNKTGVGGERNGHLLLASERKGGHLPRKEVSWCLAISCLDRKKKVRMRKTEVGVT